MEQLAHCFVVLVERLYFCVKTVFFKTIKAAVFMCSMKQLLDPEKLVEQEELRFTAQLLPTTPFVSLPQSPGHIV